MEITKQMMELKVHCIEKAIEVLKHHHGPEVSVIAIADNILQWYAKPNPIMYNGEGVDLKITEE